MSSKAHTATSQIRTDMAYRKTDQGIGPRAASFMNKALYSRAQELGVKVLLETPAKKIVMEDGKVAGVLATDKDGMKSKSHVKQQLSVQVEPDVIRN